MLHGVAYLLLAYLLTSLWEHRFHARVLHAPRASRRAWRCWPGLGALLRLAHFHHHVIHHRRTFRRSAVQQFDSAAQQAALDARLRRVRHSGVRAARYGAGLHGPVQLLAVTVPPVLLCTALALLMAPAWLWGGLAVALLPMLVSRFIHPLLHDLLPQAPWARRLARRVRGTAWFRHLQQHHHAHHANGRVNLNLVLGADWLLRTRG